MRTRLGTGLLLIVTFALLSLFPARLIVPGLTDVGRPATVVGMLLFVWWVLTRLNPHLVQVGPQPIRWVVLFFFVVVLIGYAVGSLRGLTTVESNSADRWLLLDAAFLGLILVAADGIPNWGQLRAVLRAFIWCCGFIALVGLIQYATFTDVTQYLIVPGLQEKGWVPDLTGRGDGLRVASTTGHYIEFGTLMAMALPVAVCFLRLAKTRNEKLRMGLLTLVIGAGIPTTVSRTAIVAAGMVFIFMMLVWDWRTRWNMLVLGIGAIAAAVAAKPELMRTLVEMFTQAGQDTSISSRTDRYDMVAEYFVERPWLGRGTGTWVSPMYQYLDNQWFSTALTNGLAGVAAMLALHAVAAWMAYKALRRAATQADRELCAALLSIQFVALFAAFTFDSLSFTTYSSMLAILIGFCGTVWRLTHPRRAVRTAGVLQQGQ
ncbi:hypothetical protein GCM10009682_31100 [Luedemannella flava]|uniref:O-antigen ligase-related domain-containing protein n=1 Tax=Luedemannella flava TaxID=349316 RepID=A0ABN2M2N1_9ACTN